jgi:hypothetical protein
VPEKKRSDAMAKKMSDRTCHCGYRKGDPAIQEEPEYGFFGWILLSLFGITPRPHHISFRCMYCRQELGTSTNPKLLARRSMPDKPHAATPAPATTAATTTAVAPPPPAPPPAVATAAAKPSA